MDIGDDLRLESISSCRKATGIFGNRVMQIALVSNFRSDFQSVHHPITNALAACDFSHASLKKEKIGLIRRCLEG